MNSAIWLNEHLRFLDFQAEDNLIGYSIAGNANGDEWENIQVLFNGSDTDKSVEIPSGNWTRVIEGTNVNTEGFSAFSGSSINVPAYTAVVLVNSESI